MFVTLSKILKQNTGKRSHILGIAFWASVPRISPFISSPQSSYCVWNNPVVALTFDELNSFHLMVTYQRYRTYFNIFHIIEKEGRKKRNRFDNHVERKQGTLNSELPLLYYFNHFIIKFYENELYKISKR